jgi:hypothetical protein
MGTIAVHVRNELIAKIFMRSEGTADPADLIDRLLTEHLDSTQHEKTLSIANAVSDKFLIDFGDPAAGFNWQGVFLPNSTRLRIHYKREEFQAEVRHQQVYYDGKACSPSQFVSRAANNTNRNAWNDVWVKRPTDGDWVFANDLRRALQNPVGEFLRRLQQK